jgi:hypothetical protein
MYIRWYPANSITRFVKGVNVLRNRRSATNEAGEFNRRRTLQHSFSTENCYPASTPMTYNYFSTKDSLGLKVPP